MTVRPRSIGDTAFAAGSSSECRRGGAPKNRGCKKDEAAEVPIEQPPMPGKTPYPGDLAAWRFSWQAVVCGVRLCVWSRLLRSNLLLRYSRQPRNTS